MYPPLRAIIVYCKCVIIILGRNNVLNACWVDWKVWTRRHSARVLWSSDNPKDQTLRRDSRCPVLLPCSQQDSPHSPVYYIQQSEKCSRVSYCFTLHLLSCCFWFILIVETVAPSHSLQHGSYIYLFWFFTCCSNVSSICLSSVSRSHLQFNLVHSNQWTVWKSNCISLVTINSELWYVVLICTQTIVS